jgi:Spx/MgsR family transcriptional regulator
MTTTLFGIPNCDSIKRTRKWLENHNIDYQFHDYRKDGLDKLLVAAMLEAIPLEILINKRGTTWRQLPIGVQKSLSASNAGALMQAHPAIIKRPLLRKNQHWIAGYDEDKFGTLTDS